jgi:HSP20 family protein
MFPDVRVWDPFLAIHQVREELDRLFGDEALSARPPVNLWVGEQDAVLTAEVPGVPPEKLDLAVEEEALTLSGERPETPASEGETPLRRERFTGRFSRTVRLPFRVDAEKAAARFADGVLTVTLPKAADDKPRKIAVHTA